MSRINADTLKAFKAALLDVLIELDEEFEVDVKSVMEDVIEAGEEIGIQIDDKSVLEFVSLCTLVTYIDGTKYTAEIPIGE